MQLLFCRMLLLEFIQTSTPHLYRDHIIYIYIYIYDVLFSLMIIYTWENWYLSLRWDCCCLRSCNTYLCTASSSNIFIYIYIICTCEYHIIPMAKVLYIYIHTHTHTHTYSKVGDRSRGLLESSLFNSYYTEVLGRVILLSLDCFNFWFRHLKLS